MRRTTTKHEWMRRAAAVAIAPAAILSVAACSDTSGSEQGADVEDIVDESGSGEDEQFVDSEAVDDAYIGDGDDSFYEDSESYVGETVTLSADVNEVVSPTAFSIAGTDGSTVKALLVVHPEDLSEVTPGRPVSVTGVVMEGFDLIAVEQDLGLDFDDELYDDWDGEPYLRATSVDTSGSE